MNARITTMSKRLLMTLLFSGLLLGVIALFVTPAAADNSAAQIVCSQAMSVGTTSELNEAITCFNNTAAAGQTFGRYCADQHNNPHQ